MKKMGKKIKMKEFFIRKDHHYIQPEKKKRSEKNDNKNEYFKNTFKNFQTSTKWRRREIGY